MLTDRRLADLVCSKKRGRRELKSRRSTEVPRVREFNHQIRKLCFILIVKAYLQYTFLVRTRKNHCFCLG